MIRTGDIILYRAPWWARWLMEYYHAGVAYVVDGLVSVIDASWRGVRHHWPRGKYVAVRPKGAGTFAGFIAGGWAMGQVGPGYSYRQAAAILLRALKELLAGRKVARACAYACSPLAVQAWRYAGVTFTPDAPQGYESPDDIAAGLVEVVPTGVWPMHSLGDVLTALEAVNKT